MNRLCLITQIPVLVGFYKLLNAMTAVQVRGLLDRLSILDLPLVLLLSYSASLALGMYAFVVQLVVVCELLIRVINSWVEQILETSNWSAHAKSSHDRLSMFIMYS